GWPDSVLVGELEAHTEAANRTVLERRGVRLVHLFDCIRSGGRYIAREPYRARRDALWQMQSEVVNLLPQSPYADRDGLRARSLKSGRYCRATPTDYRLTPIVPQVPVSRAGELWDQVEAGHLEGLVV